MRPSSQDAFFPDQMVLWGDPGMRVFGKQISVVLGVLQTSAQYEGWVLTLLAQDPSIHPPSHPSIHPFIQ